MPSKKSYDFLSKHKAIDSGSAYAKFDGLETEDDLYRLFEELDCIRDCDNNPLIFTANFITGNPDFEKIKSVDFREFFLEPFNESYIRYNSGANCLKVLKEGISNNYFYPELHGREHVNVNRWLKLLSLADPAAVLSFSRNCFLVRTNSNFYYGKSLVASIDFDDSAMLPSICNSISDSFSIFESIFSNSPASFIAPNYIWSPEIEVCLSKLGISSIQGTKTQKIPSVNSAAYRIKRRRFRFDNELQLSHSIRNAFFEPSSLSNPDNAIDICLRGISNAFFWGKPAIISSHRLNFISRVSVKNRDNGLLLLRNLGKEIKKRWPDALFMTTSRALKCLYE